MSTSSRRRGSRRQGAKQPASPTTTPTNTTSATRPKSKRTNAQRNSGSNQKASRRGPRFGDEYLKPDTGGTVSRSTLERDVMLNLAAGDAGQVLASLRTTGADERLISYVEAKIAWTEAYNAKL